LYVDTNTTKETEESPRRSSKVMIAKTSTNVVSRPVTETFKKSLLKSTSSSSNSVDKPAVLDVKATEIRSPSPIPEDLVGEEISKQSTSSAISDQEKIVEKKQKTQRQQQEKDDKASERETLEERKEEETDKKDENKHQQSGNTEGNNSDNTKQKTSETDKEIDTEKYAKTDTKKKELEVPSIQTTKLRGKSKATGQVMGGWI